MKWLKITYNVLTVSLACVILLFCASLAFPVTRGFYFLSIGGQLCYNGFNDIGSSISHYGIEGELSDIAELQRSFSVQHTKNGNYHLAIKALEKAKELDPEVKAYYGWVLLYYYRDYERAYQILDEYDRLSPNFSDPVVGENVNYLKGLAQLKRGNAKLAIHEFTTYIDYVSATAGEEWVDVYAFINRGTAHLKLAEYTAARQDFKKAIKHYDECTEAFYLMAQSYLKEEKVDSAKQAIQKANSLMERGWKHEINYVESFHEIYPQEVERLRQKLKSRLLK
ncbi:MAG: hypothetical protein RIC95_06535 [Vicingaceae bacterium]